MASATPRNSDLCCRATTTGPSGRQARAFPSPPGLRPFRMAEGAERLMQAMVDELPEKYAHLALQLAGRSAGLVQPAGLPKSPSINFCCKAASTLVEGACIEGD